MADDLVARLWAAITAAEESDWPHRPTCQMMKPVPAGFPFPTMTCNCDMPDLWQRRCSADRKILDLHQPDDGLDQLGSRRAPGCTTCLINRDRYPEMWEPETWPCPTVLTLAEGYGIEP